VLRSFDKVQKSHRNSAEQKHGNGVFRPPHFPALVDSRQPVNKPLDWPKHRIEKCLLAIENPHHENADRLCNQQNHEKKESDLKPTIRRHV
jgi:hypothetical protein